MLDLSAEELARLYETADDDLKREIIKNLQAIQKDQCEQSLLAFVRCFWPVVEPKTEMADGRVLEEICNHLEAVTRWYETGGKEGCQNLLINVPPGCMKSLITEVFWPAWEWGPRNLPQLRYVCSSYSEELTLRDNIRFATVIKCPLYQKFWGTRFQIVKDTEGKISNTMMGWKQATSVGGLGTGERGDRFNIDDPHNIKDGESQAKRKSTLQWWTEVVPTRLNNPDVSSIVVIMQRVHDNDVSGDIISRCLDFIHLCLPMRFDPDFPYCTTPFGGEWRTEKNELLWSERFSESAVTKLETTMGQYATAAQFQQRPSPRGGGIIKDYWWQVYDEAYAQRLGTFDPKRDTKLRWPAMEFVVASLDTAYGQKQENDYSALCILGVWRDEYDLPKIMLMDSWKKRVSLHGDMPEREPGETDMEFLKRTREHWGLVEHVLFRCKRLKVDRLLIEDKTKGKDVSDELARLFSQSGLAIELVPARTDKIARLTSVEHLFSTSCIYAPETEWAETLIRNVANFPKVEHDDDCDALSQGLRWLRDTGWALRRDERDRDLEAQMSLENVQQHKPIYDL